MADVCYYGDKEYSVGSIIEVDEGEYQECLAGTENFPDPTWGEVQEREIPKHDTKSTGAAGAPDVVMGDTDDSTIVMKKENTCYYNGQRYSLGAKLKMPNGKMKTCEATVDSKGKKGAQWV